MELANHDIAQIAVAVLDVFDLRHATHSAVRVRLLDQVRLLIPCKAYCSVLQLTDFYCKHGEVICHHHQPKPSLFKQGRLLLSAWKKHVKKRDSPVERALFAMSKNQNAGHGTLRETSAGPGLVDLEEWYRTGEGELAKLADIHDLAYAWIRCSPTDLWVICMRRFVDEPLFDGRDSEILRHFSIQIAAVRDRWYRQDGIAAGLTEREAEVLQLYKETGWTSKEMAAELGISRRTVENHLTSIMAKLGVSGRHHLR